MIRHLIVILLVALALIGVGAKGRPDQKWSSDRVHSSIEFRTQHWGIVDIIGWFEDFQITVHADEGDFVDAVVEARVKLASVRMPNSKMASNLKNLLFDLNRYPEATFTSTKVRLIEQNRYELTGKLELNGVAHEVIWEGTLNGFGYPPTGVPGFTLRTSLDRTAFGIGDELLDKTEPGSAPTVASIVVVTCNVRLDYAR